MMKKFLILIVASGIAVACQTSSQTDPDTERFYATPWETTVHRTHDEITGVLAAADETFETTATLTKSGTFNMTASTLGNHMDQSWSYSWSTDEFYMNWEPCISWYINEESDSMYLNYNMYDYDPNSGYSFVWEYELFMVK